MFKSQITTLDLNNKVFMHGKIRSKYDNRSK